MNSAEIKLDLFRKIDSLSPVELETVYTKILALINSNQEYKLSQDELAAVKDALSESDYNTLEPTSKVVAEAKEKYPNLKFK